MVEAAIYSLLSTATSVVAIAGPRIYPLLMPIDFVVPAITYQIVSSVSSPGLMTAGMQKIRVQIDCFGNDYSDAVTLRAAVVSSLNGFSGTVQGVPISNFSKISQSDLFDHDALLYRAMVEFYLLTTIQ